jgi:hypothetical protein
VKLVIIEGAQVDTVALAAAFDEAENTREEIEAGFGLIGQKLDMPKMRDVVYGFSLHAFFRRIAPSRWSENVSHATTFSGARQMGVFGLFMN